MNAIQRRIMHVMSVAAIACCLLFSGRVHANAAAAAPTGLVQTDAGSGWVYVSWNLVMQNDLTYYYRISDDASFTVSKTGRILGGERTSTMIDGLREGSLYYVQIGTSETYDSKAPADTVWSDTLETATVPDIVDSASIKQTDAGTTYLTLTWDAPSGANYYEIQYWRSGEDSDSASTLSSVTNSIQITGLQKDTKYDVRIYSYRVTSAGYKAGKSKYFYGVKHNINLLPIKVTGVENTSFGPALNRPEFKWNSVETADGYQYYVYNNSNKKIDSGKTHYSVLTVPSGSMYKKDQFYRIKVRGYITLADNKVKYGEWSDVLYFAKSPRKNVSVKQSGKNIKVSWNKVTGATNYTVYVSDNSLSGYKKVGTVKKTSTSIKKYGKSALKKGKTYYIKIVANKTVKTKGKSKTYKSKDTYNYVQRVTMKR